MGALDGYVFIGGRCTCRNEDLPEASPSVANKFYVSWDLGDGFTGRWHDTVDEAEKTYSKFRSKNSSRWYPPTRSRPHEREDEDGK